MLEFLRWTFHTRRVEFNDSPDGWFRQALAEHFGRAQPRPGDWLRLRRRAEALRPLPAAVEPLHRHYGALSRRSAAARLALDASGMAWRLPWRSSLAACPLF